MASPRFHRSLPIALLVLGCCGEASSAAMPAPPLSTIAERGTLLAQAGPAEPDPIPQEVQGWFDEAKAAYGRGAYAEALQLQEKVMGWVKRQPRPPAPVSRKGPQQPGHLSTAPWAAAPRPLPPQKRR